MKIKPPENTEEQKSFRGAIKIIAKIFAKIIRKQQTDCKNTLYERVWGKTTALLLLVLSLRNTVCFVQHLSPSFDDHSRQ